MAIGIITLSNACAATFFVYYISKIVYNYYFHSLAHIPGPWWAAVSYLPEFYYDVIKGGRYFTVIVRLHEQYGPLIRINPNQLHLNDPFFYEQVYAGNTQKTNKDKWTTELSGRKYATVSTVDHEHHRRRRSYVAPFFSKASTLRMEPFIHTTISKLIQKLTDSAQKGETIVLMQAFGALNTDIITHYAFGESFGELDVPGMPCPFVHDVQPMMLTSHFRRFLPLVSKIMESLPEAWLKWLSPALGTYFDLDHKMHVLCTKAQKEREGKTHAALGRTMFEALTEESVPDEEKSLQRLKDESMILLLAGVDTTARFVTSAVCYLIEFPHVLPRLRKELKTVGRSATLAQLEILPYLTAFINETLRYQCSVTDNFPRVPQQALQYNDLVISAGTTIGAKPWILNPHPSTFPDPFSFRPERWLEAEARGENLTRFLFTFIKGTRICLGIPLAYAELYLTIAALVRNFDFELVDSSIEDVTMYRDYALSMNKKYTFGIKVRITKVLAD